MAPLWRDLLAFLLGAAGVMADFFGAVDIRQGMIPLGLGLLLAGLTAVWGAFKLAVPGT